MDFAPYQSSPPEHSRVASPEANTTSPRQSSDAASRRPFSPEVARSPPPLQHPQPQRSWGGFDGQAGAWTGGSPVTGANVPGAYPAAEISEFDTSLGLRLDYEASLAYIALPPLGAIVLLILERNSDYVRYAFCSSLEPVLAIACAGWQLLLISQFVLGFTPGSQLSYSLQSCCFT